MIFYFSATGNTLWAAQRVAQVTGERLLSVAKLIKSQHAFALEKTSVLALSSLYMDGVRL